MYTQHGGGGRLGPSNGMKSAAMKNKSILDVFFFLFPQSLFQKISSYSHYYAYTEPVKLSVAYDPDGNKAQKKVYVSAKRREEGQTTRVTNQQFPMTDGFVMTWLGVIIIHGALHNSSTPIRRYYEKLPNGIMYPPIQNSMNRDAFEFMRRFIHLSDGRHENIRGDPLYKIREVLETVSKQLGNAWIASDKVCVDESMIKYKGRAVKFIQYMPMKPIKHGIKVFCMCCAYSAHILSFIVYTGKKETGGSVLEIVDELIRKAGLTHLRGLTLYTDNWYTSIALAKHLYTTYGWTIVGTVVPTESKSRNGHDIPFIKLSNGALRNVERGWFREAVCKVRTQSGEEFWIQVTTWRDKKQVMFVHTHKIGRSDDVKVKRYVKGKKGRIELQGTESQKDYSVYFNAVDKNDRDSAENSTSLRTSRWYLRLFFWLLDRCIHSAYLVVTSLHDEIPEWKKFTSKNGGRRKFQISLGLALMNHGIASHWDANKKPSWIRPNPVPCDCDECFFCKKGLTTGIFHNRASVVMSSPGGSRKKRKIQCTSRRVRLDVSSGQYCRQCYRNQSGTSLTNAQKRKNCKQSWLGCPSCNEPICKQCWEEGYDYPYHQLK